jgi:hypothetical protein
MNKKITHKIQGSDLDGFNAEAGASCPGPDLRRYFYQLYVFHNAGNQLINFDGTNQQISKQEG